MDWDFGDLSGEEPARLPSGSFDWKAVPYEVRDLLGTGGMGAVYRAYDPAAQREVALKVLRQDALSEKALARFRQEGEIAAALAHPNVLQIHAVWEVPPHTALVYELIEGARPIDEAWGEDLRERVRMIRDAALGLAAAHAQGVVHRDVKPDNLLVDGKGRVRVTDFGIAFAQRADRLTQSGAMVGTPVFMSPEQFHRKESPSPASDVWGLGVVLYLALSDELPFPGPDFGSLITQVRGGATSQTLGRLGEAPPPLIRVVREALRPQAADRFTHAGEFATALTAWLEGSPLNSKGRGATLLATAGALLFLLLGLAFALRPEASPSPTPSPQTSPQPSRQASPGAAPTGPGTGSPRGTPPPALLADLASPQGARSGLAALALLRDWPDGDHVEAARVRVDRLRREPLIRFYAQLPPKIKSKDWEIGFDFSGEQPAILGLADRCGLYVRWDLRTGKLVSRRLIPLSWSLAAVFPSGRALAIPRRDPGLLEIDLVGKKDTWVIPRGEEPVVLSMAWPKGGPLWILNGDRLLSYSEDHQPQGSFPLPHSTDQGRITVVSSDELFVSLGDLEREICEFYRVSTRTGEWKLLFELPGTWPHTVYHPERDVLLAATTESALAVYAEGRKRVFQRRAKEGGFRTLRLVFREGGETFWSYGHPIGKNTPCFLELNRVGEKGLEVLASRTMPVVTGDSRLSPCGRFWVIGFGNEPNRRQAAEVWYVGPEVLTED